jgi:hypothetical protein
LIIAMFILSLLSLVINSWHYIEMAQIFTSIG